MSKMEEIKQPNRLHVRQRLTELWQAVPRDPDDHWLYEYEGELHTPTEWLVICERVSGDDVALDQLSRARTLIIDEEPLEA